MTEKHDSGADVLNGANGGWRRWQCDNVNIEMEEEEAALRHKHVQNAQGRKEGEGVLKI